MIKIPTRKNRFSGNVCLSHQEFEAVKNGTNQNVTVLREDAKPSLVTVEQWMIDAAEDKGDYILFPYSKKSRLLSRKK